MKMTILCSLLCVGFSALANPGDLIKVTHLTDTTAQEVAPLRQNFCPQEANVTTTYGFKRYKVDFKTLDIYGDEVPSSGMLIIPDTDALNLPTFVYQHGTVTARTELPSGNAKFGESDAVGYCFASLGYVSVMADYLGYGDGTGFHPYLHADSEAWVAHDMLHASIIAADQMRISRSEKLFIAGYSQGGHAAMALTKFIEEDPEHEYVITASAPMAGPYALPETLSRVLANPTSNSPSEGAFIMLGLNALYGFYSHPSEIFQAKFSGVIESLFDGTHEFPEVVKTLGTSLPDLFIDKTLKDMADPNSYFTKAMKLNSVYQWTPKTKMHLYHAKGDHEVPFLNSQMAFDYMMNQKADVELINLGDTLTHQQAFPFAFGQAALWFETLR